MVMPMPFDFEFNPARPVNYISGVFHNNLFPVLSTPTVSITTALLSMFDKMTEPATGKPLQIYIFSHPRTASNLFCKLFSQHPSIHQEKYPFLFAYGYGPEAQMQMVSKEMDELRKAYKDIAKDMTYQASLDKIQNLSAETKKAGKFLMLKDHSHLLTTSDEVRKMLGRPHKVGPEPKMEDKMLDLSENERAVLIGSPYHDPNAGVLNPTVLPDRMMRSFAPVFIIRHPIKQIESWYRASRVYGMRPDESDFEIRATYRFSKRLFDYYVELCKSGGGNPVIPSNDPIWPVVIDGDDLINDTEGIANRFCKLAGLDPKGVIYRWEPEKTFIGPLGSAFLGTLEKSGGVKRIREFKVPDVSESYIKWSEEWGPEVGKMLVQFVENMMPDYEYLHQYRLKSEAT